MKTYNSISLKKPTYPIKSPLKEHLKSFSRWVELPICYDDLTQYYDLIPLTDDEGNPTHWYGVLFKRSEVDHIREQLCKIYELLVADGTSLPFLKIERVDLCAFGNSQPFRVKVVNELNDNHDYFYLKRADSSRIYGLELEEIFSPDKVSFLVGEQTLVEEHVVGVPCDNFIKDDLENKLHNKLRFVKEFVKFNERCFTRLLGDMRAYNFVVEITQDFDNVNYRLRPIDFDQQNLEGRKSIYLPQFYKENYKLVEMASNLLSSETARQYQHEERVAMRKRYFASRQRTKSLLRKMKKDKISLPEHIAQLRSDLAQFHKKEEFLQQNTMADILTLQLETTLNTPILNN